MKTITKITFLTATVFVLFGMFTFSTQVTETGLVFGINQAEAVAPGGGDGGCCGGDGDDPTPTPTPTPEPEPEPEPEPDPVSCDSFIATPDHIVRGQGVVTLAWETTGATRVTLTRPGGEIQNVAHDGQANATPVNSATFVITVYGATNFWGVQDSVTCEATVTVETPAAPSCDTFTGSPATLPYGGGNVNLEWTTSNVDSVSINHGVGTVAGDGSKLVNVTNTITYILTASKAGYDDAFCPVTITVDPLTDELTCNDVVFDSTPSSPVAPGTSVNLSWVFTGDVTSATIDNGIGDGLARTNADVTINNTTTFNATIANASSNISCPYTVTVAVATAPDISIIKRDAVDKDDTQAVSVGGTAHFEIVVTNTGNEDLVNVVVTDPLEPTCDKTIGHLAIGANHTYTCESTNVQSNFTNVANVTGNSAVDNQVVDDTDPTNVTIPTSGSFSCEANVTFSASDTSLPLNGDYVTFTWNVIDADSVSITGLTSTDHSDTEVAEVNDDETFTLVATKAGFTPISCPITIDVASGGGGGGSSSPKCELDISDEKIKAGEEITLEWDTTRAKEVRIEDDHGNVLIDSDDKDDFDGKMTIKPTKDTEYTLFSIKGSKEKKCKVEVEVENKVTVYETRTQDPRVAGISLTQVPYTGFEAGPALTMIFYTLLTIWGLFVAYIFAVRRDFIGGVSLAGAHDHVAYTDMSTTEAVADVEAETEAESYVHAVAHTDAPVNLPTAMPVIGYAATLETDEVDESIEMTELENRAHAQKILLSSDAMRFFMNATEAGETRNEKLDAAIAQAKASFPSEGGWVALNLARIETLITNEEASEEVETETEAINGGSLAEAIVTGNVVAAYQMIAHRPMIALADAAADLDAVYRSRKGEAVTVSDMLATSVAAVSTESLTEAIAALTGALDGTYDSEAEAVKMAIMKAVKSVS